MIARVLAIVVLMVVSIVPRADAVPAFAQQTGQPCTTCHIGSFGPQLTPFGRAFKIGGYTLRDDSPHSQMAPNICAKRGCAASIWANRLIRGSRRKSVMFGMSS